MGLLALRRAELVAAHFRYDGYPPGVEADFGFPAVGALERFHLEPWLCACGHDPSVTQDEFRIYVRWPDSLVGKALVSVWTHLASGARQGQTLKTQAGG